MRQTRTARAVGMADIASRLRSPAAAASGARARIALLLCALLWCFGTLTAHAQDGGLRVGLIRPMEGETYYAGPSTVVYSIKIDGWVAGAADPRAVSVRLDILQGAQAHNTVTLTPDADGTFLVDATVNPAGAHGDFGPVEIVSRCDECHYRAPIELPNGAVTLALTATTPDGQQARLERHFVVDRSTTVTVPVNVVIEGQPGQRVSGVPVSASTRMYLWRARHATAATDANGIAQIAVEVSTQGPVRYAFRVEPTIIQGVRYEGIRPVELELPPAASSATPVTLVVSARLARIEGRVLPLPDVPLAVRAIRLPDGVSYQAKVGADSAFAFDDMPIGRYLVTLDTPALTSNGWTSVARTIDLAADMAPQVDLTLVRISGATQRGVVRDETGAPLPFGWLSLQPDGATTRPAPDTGEFTMTGVPPDARTLVASAPGYYSQAQVVNAATAASLILTPRPETRRIAWGPGAIVIPAESEATLTGNTVALAQGWLWGKGGAAEPLVISTDIAQITIAGGIFAVEQLTYQVEQSPQYAGWLEVLDGEAVVAFARTSERVVVKARQMLALTNEPTHSVIPFDALVLDQLRSEYSLPPGPVWEPSPGARLRDGLALIGISAAQAVTFVIYSAVVLSLLLAPVFGFTWWRRRHPRGAGK